MRITARDASELVWNECNLTLKDGNDTYNIGMKKEWRPSVHNGEECFVLDKRTFFIEGLDTPFNSNDGDAFDSLLKERIFKGRKLELVDFEFGSQRYGADELHGMLYRILDNSPTLGDILKRFDDADTVLLTIHQWYSGIGSITDLFDFNELLEKGLDSSLFDEDERQMLRDSFISVEFKDFWDYDSNILVYRFRLDDGTKEWLRSFLYLYEMYPFQDMCLYKNGLMIMSSISHEGMCSDMRARKMLSDEDFHPPEEEEDDEDGKIYWERII